MHRGEGKGPPCPFRERVCDILRPPAFHLMQKLTRLLSGANGEEVEVDLPARLSELEPVPIVLDPEDWG